MYLASPHEPILHNRTQLTMYIFCRYLILLWWLALNRISQGFNVMRSTYSTFEIGLVDRNQRIEHPCFKRTKNVFVTHISERKRIINSFSLKLLHLVNICISIKSILTHLYVMWECFNLLQMGTRKSHISLRRIFLWKDSKRQPYDAVNIKRKGCHFMLNCELSLREKSKQHHGHLPLLLFAMKTLWFVYFARLVAAYAKFLVYG